MVVDFRMFLFNYLMNHGSLDLSKRMNHVEPTTREEAWNIWGFR